MTPDPEPRPDRLTPQARRRVLRAALFRPWALIVLAIGLFFFFTTLTWWALPLTLATYAALVALAARDPVFQALALEGREKARAVARSRMRRVALSPEARVRRLPQGENRDRVEAALEARDRVLIAIRGSDEATQGLFSPAVPKLDRATQLLLDLAEARERAPDAQSENAPAIDAELSRAPEDLQALRSEVVRASIEGDDEARSRAERFERTLDETVGRLEELSGRT